MNPLGKKDLPPRASLLRGAGLTALVACSLLGSVAGSAQAATSDARLQASFTSHRLPRQVRNLHVRNLGNRVATVAWRAPRSPDADKVTGYQVLVTGSGKGAVHTLGGAARRYRATGLDNDRVYSVRVRAMNAKGAGPLSNPVKVESYGTPATMAAPVITAGESTTPSPTVVPRVSWSSETDRNGGPITRYTVYRRRAGRGAATEVCSVSASASRRCSTPALKNDGSKYQFAVTATNSSLPSGHGSAESKALRWVSFTATGVPNQISDVKAFASQSAFASGTRDHGPSGGTGPGFDGALKVRFTVPAPNGPSVSGVQYSTDGGSNWQALSASSYRPGATATATISGLTNGTGYSIELRASNGTNYGPPSGAAAAEFPYTTPDDPTLSANTNSDPTTVDYSWDGSGHGGRAVAHYWVSVNGAAATDQGANPGSGSFSVGYDSDWSVSVYAVDTAGQQTTVVSQSGHTEKVPTPTGLGCSANGTTTISCSWNGASGMQYQWSWDNTTDWNGLSGSTSTSRDFGSSQSHTLFVRASDGNNHYSDPISAQATTSGP